MTEKSTQLDEEIKAHSDLKFEFKIRVELIITKDKEIEERKRIIEDRNSQIDDLQLAKQERDRQIEDLEAENEKLQD